MSPWHLELLRLWRTGGLIALVATFLIVGLGIPVLTYFLPRLVENSSGEVQITLPEQTAADGIIGYASNIGQIGTLVVVVVAAASFAIDVRPGLAAFYRTRVGTPMQLILPRWISIVVASVIALILGTLGAWYETTVLLGHVNIDDLVVGLMLQALWFCFVICIVVGFAGVLRGVLGIVGSSIALLLVLALLGSIPDIASWLPTRLATAISIRFDPDPAANAWHAIVVTIAVGIAAFGFGVNGLGRREVQ